VTSSTIPGPFRRWRWLPTAGLAALPFLVYANGYDHAYQLDDTYTLVTNPSVRSLANIPRYFVDPGTYTSVREQVDYRPVLQVSYALNYAINGYRMQNWHFTQILLHALVTVGLFLLCKRLLALGAGPPSDATAFVAAAVFAVHPASSGVVNYLNARSSLLTAAFLVPALLAYLKPVESAEYRRPQWTAALWYTLALFTKVEAVGALGALWAFELWQRGRETGAGVIGSAVATLDKRTLRRLAPALAVTLVYFVIRARLMAPFPFGDSRHAPDVGAYEYLVTQFTAWWHYVARWVAPISLVADNLAYPVYRSWREPVVLLAAGGWLLVIALLVAAWRRAPWLTFVAIATLALLSPTSSIAPLAEMVNEHRPYLAIGVLWLGVAIPSAQLVRLALTPSARAIGAAALVILMASLGALTWRRNTVFHTAGAYWKDILDKAPSSRAHLNYGLSRMQAGDYPNALKHYRLSLEEAPYWYYTHINLGVAFQNLGNADSARAHFDIAVQNDRFSGQALLWRGEFLLSRRSFAAARGDFLASQPLSLQSYRVAKGLATAASGLGDAGERDAQVARMRALDSAATGRDLAAVLAAGDPRAARESIETTLMTEGLTLLRENDAAGAAAKFREILAGNPTHYGAHYQLAASLDRLGRRDESRALWRTVLKMAEGYKDEATIRTARARLERNP